MKRMLVALLFGVAASLIAFFAIAQPMHGSPLEMLGTLDSQLNLNTSQQQQWSTAVALTATARDAMHASIDQGRAALATELAKAEPDFASLVAASRAARQQTAALHRQALDAWLALYATFTPEQKAVARDAIKAGIARMEARRAMLHGGAPATN
jgi:Spy/CpxP family protein refolding chaperone